MEVKTKGKIYRISGPVVVAEGLNAKMYELVKVGSERLLGEVIQINGNKYTIQVYEETTGLRPGEPVERTGGSLFVELGPGMLSQIYDGIQRPLPVLQELAGAFISRGLTASALDEKKKWDFVAKVKKGDSVAGGSVLGTVQETKHTVHKILVHPKISGKIKEIHSGKFTVREPVAELEDGTKLYLSFSCWKGRLSRSHIPSSAESETKLTPQTTANAANSPRIFFATFSSF